MIEELTIELVNSQKMVNDLKICPTKYIEYKDENEIITGKPRIFKQRVRILEEKVRQDEEKVKVKLGETMLNLPNLGRKWKGTCNARRYLFGLMI